MNDQLLLIFYVMLFGAIIGYVIGCFVGSRGKK